MPGPISRCRLSKSSDSCRLPGYGNGDWKPLSPNGNAWERSAGETNLASR